MGSSGQKESVLDVLSRMNYDLNFDTDGEVATTNHASSIVSTKPSLAPAANKPIGTSEPKSISAKDAPPSEPLEEVGNYMGDLLKRYGKGAAVSITPTGKETHGDSVSSPESHLPQRKQRPVDDAKPVAGENNSASKGPEQEDLGEIIPGEVCLLDLREFVPRKRAPEEKACIDAMRELAVHSVRRAIQVCDNKKRGFDAKHRLILAFGAFAVSGVAFLYADGPFSILGCGAMCGTVIGCTFVVNWQKTVALLKKSNGA